MDSTRDIFCLEIKYLVPILFECLLCISPDIFPLFARMLAH
jgi:hypothetical protein